MAAAATISDQEHLSRRDFLRLAELIRDTCGIQLGPEKLTMVEVRLRRRLRARNIATYDEYCDLIFAGNQPDEIVSLIDVITTNKTDFFREPGHYQTLQQQVLPQLNLEGRPLRLWSAACSTGEEPYTLAMILEEYALNHRGFSYRILASDISTEVLAHASQAIYSEDLTEPIPKALRLKYLLRSRDRNAGRMRIAPELRARVEFRRLNFMDSAYNLDATQHIVFCRNALIYFDRATQEQIIRKLLHNTLVGGYLFIGHSETLNQMDLPVRQVSSTVYQKI